MERFQFLKHCQFEVHDRKKKHWDAFKHKNDIIQCNHSSIFYFFMSFAAFDLIFLFLRYYVCVSFCNCVLFLCVCVEAMESHPGFSPYTIESFTFMSNRTMFIKRAWNWVSTLNQCVEKKHINKNRSTQFFFFIFNKLKYEVRKIFFLFFLCNKFV